MPTDTLTRLGVEDARQLVARLGPVWGVPDLHERVTIEFSRRLTSGLGVCRPILGRLTIADRLRDGPRELLGEVVAHEAAHAATYHAYGLVPSPHGPEWKALMTAAGYPARRLLEVPEELRAAPRPRRYLWEHSCLTCPTTRLGGRPVYEWRCLRCWRAGLSGTLHITRLKME